MARFFMGFTQRESCGKCGPCRESEPRRMLETAWNGSRGGEGEMEALDRLEETGEDVSRASVPVRTW